MMAKLPDDSPKERDSKTIIGSTLLFILSLFVFLLSIDLMGGVFKHLSGEASGYILATISNPFVSLFIGLLITAIFQSSSATTSIVVALVAAGSITLQQSIPLVMGANVGTTLTSTLVSLGFINRGKLFRKAISAGTVHDFFNILLVALLFPLEYHYGILSGLAQQVTFFITPNIRTAGEGMDMGFYLTRDAGNFITGLVDNNIITLILAVVLLFGSLKVLSKIIYGSLIGDSQKKFKRFIFTNPFKSFGWGALVTAGVQSSSLTTSLVVLFVANGKVSLKKAFPFIMGANLGTTVTALLAAIFTSEAAISVAIAHFLFNLIGVAIFLPVPALRAIPYILAREFGKLTIKYRMVGFLYIILTFFVVPFLLIYFNQ